MVDPKKKKNSDDALDNDGDPADIDKTAEIHSNELTTPIDPPTDDVSATGQSSTHESSSQRKTVVRRGGQKSTSADEQGPQGTVKLNPSLMAGENISATINTRELTVEDAKIWATAVAGLSISQVVGKQIVGGQSNDAMETEETVDGSQMDSGAIAYLSTGEEIASGGGTAEIPAIERTVSDRNFDRLRVCEITPLKTEPKSNSDYRLIRKLGQGGMGDVFVARQGSLDRLLALKLIKPIKGKRRQKLMQTGRLDEVERERRLQFLSEAIVTGDLDHPNIVPIHDVALTADGELFYSMKRVIGTPWSDEIRSMSIDDNLEVLMKVCDAIAQAHTRGVVHRDIKPENIMLGEFGVVMVMDWGLALPTARYFEKRESTLMTSTGLGGTPAFMSPEMATGPIDKIGTAADVYLLGATLFMIVTGKAPHHASTVTECLQAVRENKIREVGPEHQGELLDIAYRAMETDPADRFESVTDFQHAIRDFVRHSGSIQQSHQASQSLAAGLRHASYDDFSKARYQYEAALRLWSENVPAAEGLEATLIQHAEAALAKEDFDLGLSLLDENRRDHQDLIAKLRDGKRQRAARETGLRWMKRLAAAMLLFIIVGGGAGLLLINQKRKEATDALELAEIRRVYAEEQKTIADQQTAKANQQTEIAVNETVRANQLAAAEAQAKQDAVDQARLARAAEQQAVAAKQAAEHAREAAEQARVDAERAREDAVRKRRQAIAATKRANYEEYVSKIGLAKASLERNESEVARKILRELKQKSPYATGWEWRWLWRQADGAETESKLDQPAADFSASGNGDFGAVLLADGQVQWWTLSENGRATVEPRVAVESRFRDPATAVAVAGSNQRRLMATGHQSGQVIIHGTDDPFQLGSHEAAVSDLKFAGNRYLVSSSVDRTVRVWDLERRVELTKSAACWHGAPVQHIAVVRKPGMLMIAAATSTDTAGRVELWKVPLTETAKPQQLGIFAGHDHPVSAIAFGRNGMLAASGDVDGNLLIWNPKSLSTVDYESAIEDSLAKFTGDRRQEDLTHRQSSANFVRLVDDKINNSRTLVANRDALRTKPSSSTRAHRDVIRAISFDHDAGSIVSASNDHTLKEWNVNARTLGKTLRGHGGWVTGVRFVPGEKLRTTEGRIISVSQDRTIRVWNPVTYVGDSAESPLPTMAQPHAVDISSARFSPDNTRVLTASSDHTAAIMTIDPDTLAFRDVVRLQRDRDNIDRLDEGTPYVAMSIATDNQSKYLYIGSADSTVRVWDVSRGVQRCEVVGTGLNDVMAVSGDGTLLLTGSNSPKTKAILWQVDPTGKAKAKVLYRLAGHDQAVTALAISDDGKLLFTGDGVGYGILWNAQTGLPIGPPIENVRGFRIGAAQFAGDARSLWLGADDGQLTQLDLASRQNLCRLNHDGFVTKLSISSDEQYAVTVNELLTESQLESRAILWDLRTKKSVMLARSNDQLSAGKTSGSGNRKRVTSAAFGKTGRGVIVCQSSDKGRAVIKLWNDVSRIVGSKPSQAFELPSRLGVAQSVIPLAQGKCLTLNENAAFAWQLSDGKLQRSYRAHARLTEAAFSPDGKWVATASRSVKLWDAATGEVASKIEAPHIGPVRSVDFHPSSTQDGGYRFATSGDDGIVRFWNWKPGKPPMQAGVYESNSSAAINFVRYSSDGKRLLLGGDEGVARILAVDDSQALPVKKTVWKFDLAESDVDLLCGAFSADGNCVAIGGNDNQGYVWMLDQAEGQSPAPIFLSGHAGTIEDIKVASDGALGYRVFTASSDDSVKVWDPRQIDGEEMRQGREILALQKHRGDVTAIDLSRDGRLMVTAGKNGQVILWPAEPVEEIGDQLFD